MVLLSVMAVLALLAVMAVGVGVDTGTGTALVRNELDAAKARNAADAGVFRALQSLITAKNTRTDALSTFPATWEFDGGPLTVSVIDTSGLININRASTVTLRKLLGAVGLDSDQADRLADAIIDYRDADDNRRIFGAEDRDYRDAGLTRGAKDRAYEKLSELRLVMGMDEAIYAAIRPALTLHGRSRRVNLSLAPPLVRQALTGGAASDGAPEPAKATVEPRRERVRGLANRVFHIRAEAHTTDGAVFVRAAVIALTQDGHRPFTIIEWARGTSRD